MAGSKIDGASPAVTGLAILGAVSRATKSSRFVPRHPAHSNHLCFTTGSMVSPSTLKSTAHPQPILIRPTYPATPTDLPKLHPALDRRLTFFHDDPLVHRRSPTSDPQHPQRTTCGTTDPGGDIDGFESYHVGTDDVLRQGMS